MKNYRSGFVGIVIGILIALAVLGFGGYEVYQNHQLKMQEAGMMASSTTPSQDDTVSHSNIQLNPEYASSSATTDTNNSTNATQNSSASTNISVEGMQQYTDSNFGFSFWYPSNWNTQETSATDSLISGGTITKKIIVSPTQYPSDGIAIEEFVSSAKSITDNSNCGPLNGCSNSIQYYFDSSSHTWMESEFGIDGTQANKTFSANVSTNSMGGLHILFGNARFGDDEIIPLSASHFLVIRNVSAGTNQVELLAKTVLALDPAVATPMSISEQIQTIQAEEIGYKPLVTTTTANTSGWQTYDSGRGFSFKYPSDWIEGGDNPQIGFVVLYPNSKGAEAINKTISVTDEVWVSINNSPLDTAGMQLITIGGQTYYVKTINQVDGGTEPDIEYSKITGPSSYVLVSSGISNKAIVEAIVTSFN